MMKLADAIRDMEVKRDRAKKLETIVRGISQERHDTERNRERTWQYHRELQDKVKELEAKHSDAYKIYREAQEDYLACLNLVVVDPKLVKKSKKEECKANG